MKDSNPRTKTPYKLAKKILDQIEFDPGFPGFILKTLQPYSSPRKVGHQLRQVFWLPRPVGGLPVHVLPEQWHTMPYRVPLFIQKGAGLQRRVRPRI
jgi:hypothetical protein